MSRLSPCNRCDRHVRRSDVRCPFCGSDRSSVMAPLVAAAVALAGCGEPAPTASSTPTVVVTTPPAQTTSAAPTATATATAVETALPSASAAPTSSASGASPLPTATLTERPMKPMYGMPPPQDRPRMKYGMPPM